MSDKAKTPIHKHTHPAYGWVALIISSVVILGLAGWYYLTYTNGLEDDVVLTVQSLDGPAKDTSASKVSSPVEIDTEVGLIDSELDAVNETEFSEIQLDDNILGIQ